MPRMNSKKSNQFNISDHLTKNYDMLSAHPHHSSWSCTHSLQYVMIEIKKIALELLLLLLLLLQLLIYSHFTSAFLNADTEAQNKKGKNLQTETKLLL